VMNMNGRVQPMLPEYSMASKVTRTELCYENAHDAIQIQEERRFARSPLNHHLIRHKRLAM